MGAMGNLDNRDSRVSDCFDDLEQKLYAVGTTAIEDALQDSVPETILVWIISVGNVLIKVSIIGTKRSWYSYLDVNGG